MTNIDPKRRYTTRDIVNEELIHTPFLGTVSEDYIRRIIRSGELKSRNVSRKHQPRYVVIGQDIIDFINKQ